jgi:hypothetical protein
MSFVPKPRSAGEEVTVCRNSARRSDAVGRRESGALDVSCAGGGGGVSLRWWVSVDWKRAAERYKHGVADGEATKRFADVRSAAIGCVWWSMGDRKKKETQTRGGGADIMELALTYRHRDHRVGSHAYQRR